MTNLIEGKKYRIVALANSDIFIHRSSEIVGQVVTFRKHNPDNQCTYLEFDTKPDWIKHQNKPGSGVAFLDDIVLEDLAPEDPLKDALESYIDQWSVEAYGPSDKAEMGFEAGWNAALAWKEKQ